MSENGAIQIEGTILGVLPNGLFQVELENGYRLQAHVPKRHKKDFETLSPGDKVRMELSPYDLSQGRIKEKVVSL